MVRMFFAALFMGDEILPASRGGENGEIWIWMASAVGEPLSVTVCSMRLASLTGRRLQPSREGDCDSPDLADRNVERYYGP